MIMAEAISTPESRQRFLRTGVHGFHAATLVQKSAQSVQSVDQTPFVPPVTISEIRKLSSGRCLRGEDPYSRCYMPNANRWRSRMMAGGKKQYYLDMESALYLLGGGNNGRYYDAATGRFLSEDPTKEAGGDENLYRYASNDPVNNLDPSGHKKQPPPQHTFHPPQTQPAQGPNAHVNGAGQRTATHGTAGKQNTGTMQPLPENIQHDLLHKPELPVRPSDPVARQVYDAQLGYQQARDNQQRSVITGTTTGSVNPSPITAWLGGSLQGSSGVAWKFDNAISFNLWSKIQPANPNPDANKPTVGNAISNWFVNVAATFFPIGGTEESGARDLTQVGEDVERQVAHPDVPAATGAKTATENTGAKAAEQAGKSAEEQMPQGVLKNEEQQAKLLQKQQPQLKQAIEQGGAKAKGRVLQQQGKEAEDITRSTLNEVPGADVLERAPVGKGIGSEIDNLVTRGNKGVYVETKLTISKLQERTLSQLRNAVREAGKKGYSVILQVARAADDKEEAKLLKVLGKNVYNKVKIVSTQTDLFKAVETALK